MFDARDFGLGEQPMIVVLISRDVLCPICWLLGLVRRGGRGQRDARVYRSLPGCKSNQKFHNKIKKGEEVEIIA